MTDRIREQISRLRDPARAWNFYDDGPNLIKDVADSLEALLEMYEAACFIPCKNGPCKVSKSEADRLSEAIAKVERLSND